MADRGVWHVQVRLLGSVDVIVDGQSRPVSGARRKALLAVLALHAGEIVGTDRLIEIVWADGAPVTVYNSIQSHVSNLRRLLTVKTAIVARPPGYVLDLASTGPVSAADLSTTTDVTDVLQAERLIRLGRQATDPADTVSHLRAALDLWRGPSLADVSGTAWLDGQAQRLERIRLETIHDLVEARLVLGEHSQLVPELERLTQQYPLREDLHGQLMLALYRTGRQADALATYQRLRRTLDDDLGIDPSPELRELHAAILRQEPHLAAAAPPPAPIIVTTLPAQTTPVPAQLPPAVAAYAGRTYELEQLDRWLAGASEYPTAAPIAAITGTAGVGKTALAVHWAHRMADRFPDGQLYVNLHGFDPVHRPTLPAQAIRAFLDALAVPVHAVPADPIAQTGLYRSLIAGKRILIVLDNAATVDQVRPLLPGAPGCAVLVTSRNQLAGLAAADGARLLTLEPLTRGEAWDLLAARLGPARTAAEPRAVDDIIASSAGLPLALVVAAARACVRPGLSLAALATELDDDQTRLDVLDGGDPATRVRAVFSWSYQRLSDDAAALFRALSQHSGPDISLPAVASLVGCSVPEARTRTTEVVTAGLLSEHRPGRFAVHDLLRVYAVELAEAVDSDETRRARARRVLDYYVQTGYAGALLLNPHRYPIAIPPGDTGLPATPLADSSQARDWFIAEYAPLLAAISYASRFDFDRHCYQLAWTMVDFLDRQGHWPESVANAHDSVNAAERMADSLAQADAHRYLAGALSRVREYADAHHHLQHALALFTKLNDDNSQARTHLSMCWLYGREGRDEEALDAGQQALDLYRLTGDRVGEAQALNAVGWYSGQLGDPHKTLAYCQQSLGMARDLRHRSLEAGAWDSLGFAYYSLNQHDRAADCYERALRLHSATDERLNQAVVLTHLGDTHHAAGNGRGAQEAWRRAQAIFDVLGHPDVAHVRAKLDAIASDPARPPRIRRPAQC
jgi:DNA-binding SARP family transcriptional activator/tetratricopeptide (TPR) repeat protein